MSLEHQIDQTDLTFFTNQEGQTLLSRFRSTLKDTQLFDVLVGYFRSSGFYQLYDALEPVDKIRILVGLSMDKDSYDMIQYHEQNATIDFESFQRTKTRYKQNLKEEIENSNGKDEELEIGIRKFIEFLKTDCQDPEKDRTNDGNGKKLEIRVYPSKNIHAKVYIGRFKPEDRDYGFVITGSSNFSESGLVANREFNVELRTKRDVLFAEDQFNQLWKDSADISEDFVDTIQNNTWLNDKITPYELYLKLIYEYLEEEINVSEAFDPFLPDGFMNLKYQTQAAVQAKKILDDYNGVFLADVVGLGKTFIAALLLQQLRGRTLVVCPPVLKDYWQDSLFDFGIRSFEVESLGKLEHIIAKGVERYDYIVVDEAHRFRNESTQSYDHLFQICSGKKVILVTATPLNNTMDDILSQLKLFQAPRKSDIPGLPNLEKYFAGFRSKLNKLDKMDPAYKELIKEVSVDIKNRVLRHVMVRRTRKDIITYFKKDMDAQGLSFPDLEDPRKIVYEYKGDLESTFNETMRMLQGFNYARYTPLLYFTDNKGLTEFERQQQRNIGGFMKGILVKRLESSIYAFRQSIDRFITSYEKFIDMYHTGTIYISKKVDVYDLMESDNLEKLEALVQDEKAHKYDAKDFREDFIDRLVLDLEILNSIKKIWEPVNADPKLEQFVSDLRKVAALKENKLVIFTESKETGDYLYEALIDEFPAQVMFYSSKGGRHTNKTLTSNHTISREIIKANFDPKHKEPQDDLKILIATDVLSEGVNLHRSNVLVNYDLPWNPTRVLQRVGRVNRLGGAHPKIHIFNFFPTTQSDEHLGLEVNITNKIQMFHDILGEDARYLSDGEEFGSQELFSTLSNKKSYTGEDQEGDSELKYLELIRQIRDEHPKFFEKIKRLPKKARSGFAQANHDGDELITFFRKGRLKKFYTAKNGESTEITFFDAVNQLECKPETPRSNTPKTFFALLETNKRCFEKDSLMEEEEAVSSGNSSVKYIEKRLKDRSFKNYQGFTESNEEFIRGVQEVLAQGKITKKKVIKIKQELEKVIDPLKMIGILEKYITVGKVDSSLRGPKLAKREVILSGYLTN